MRLRMSPQHVLVQGVFEYGGQKYDLIPHPEGASAATCARLVKLVLKQNEPCGAEQVHFLLVFCSNDLACCT